MRSECIRILNRTAGRLLSKSELNRIEEGITDQIKQIPQEHGLSISQKYRLSASKALEAQVKDTVKTIQSSLYEMSKRQVILKDLDAIEPGIYGKTKAFDQKLFYSAGSTEISLEKKIEASLHKAFAPFAEFKKFGSKYLGFSSDKEAGLDVAKEILGEKTNNPKAGELAKLYESESRMHHRNAEEAGIGFKYRKNRLPQPMNALKVSSHTKADFVDTVMGLIDKTMYKDHEGKRLSDDKIAETLGNIYVDTVNRHYSTPNTTLAGKIGKQREFERFLNFSDSQAYMTFMEKFGTSTNIVDILTMDIRRLSRDVTIAREMGANADSFVKSTIEKLSAEDALASAGLGREAVDVFGRNKIDVLRKNMLTEWELMSRGAKIDSIPMSNFFSGGRAINSANLLGKHPIDAFLEDGVLSTQMLNRMGVTRKDIKQITKLPWKERKALLSDVAVLSEGMIAQGRHMSEDSNLFAVGQQLQTLVHKLSLAEHIDHRNIANNVLVIHNQVGRMTEQYSSLTDLMNDPKLESSVKKFFKQLDDTSFQLIKRAEMIDGHDGSLSMRTSNGVRDLSNDSIKDIVAPIVEEKTAWHKAELQKIQSKRQSKIDPALKSIEDKYNPKIKEATKELARREKTLADVEVKRTKEVVALEKKIKSFKNKISGKEERLAALIQQQKTIPQDLQQNLEKAKANGDVKTAKLIEQQINSRSKLLEAKHINPLKTEIAKQKKEQTHLLNKTDKLLKKETTKGMVNLERRFGTLVGRIVSDEDRLDVWIKKQRAVPQNLQKNLERAISSGDKKAIKSAEKDIKARAALFEAKHIAPRKAKLAELRKEQSSLAEKRKYLETSEGREQYLKKANKAIADQRTKVEELTTKFESEYTSVKTALQDYMKSELDEIHSQLNKLLEQESNILKEKVANSYHALVLSTIQTTIRGAMGATIKDKSRLGLIKYPAGTLGGELLRCAYQFKMTPIGLHMMHLHTLPEAEKSPKGASLSVDPSFMRMKFVATMAGMGLVSAIVKTLIKGEDPIVSKTLKQATLENGAIVPYYQELEKLLLDPGLQKATSLLGSLPSSTVDLASAIARGSGKDAIRSSRNFVPLMRMWYTQGAFDSLIYYQLLNLIDPGHSTRKQIRDGKKQDKSYFRNLDEFLPSRMPEPKLYRNR
ncbi:MAG: hypothetical protein C4617_04700 [Candidatus Liberibacter europaeus]|uniref:Uncharacterized protein n=1 Tax=Candidatus Liberibacter europaeus TaxID=744859 RepID=A0A2T4VWM0_9HYPH|nr:hypothetical protein [Candidatus Liberibacter europaeus]PTL86175.1 MAG: hypothetical protein C4617_04700 [Candidatus Liberibacter europaeus]